MTMTWHRRHDRAELFPDGVPVLGRGKHRNAKKGACFMEYASFLAGERWSDHPSCTHPVLAGLARSVNDHIGDGARQELVELVPSVVGLTSDRADAGALIARECAVQALPIAAEERQRVLALGLLRCEQVLSGDRDARPGERVEEALRQAPAAYAWARAYRGPLDSSRAVFDRVAVPTIVESSVRGIALAAVDDTDQRLIAMLRRLVAACELWFAPRPEAPVAPVVREQAHR
jgi:hypothetical protein